MCTLPVSYHNFVLIDKQRTHLSQFIIKICQKIRCKSATHVRGISHVGKLSSNRYRQDIVRLKPDGTRWRTGGEVKGKPASGVGSQYSHTTSGRGVSSITNADAHTSAASSRLNWRPRRFKWTRRFRRKTKSGFCACAITFQTQSTTSLMGWRERLRLHTLHVYFLTFLKLNLAQTDLLTSMEHVHISDYRHLNKVTLITLCKTQFIRY